MTYILAQGVIYLDAGLAIASGINDDGIADVSLYGTGNTVLKLLHYMLSVILVLAPIWFFT